MQALLHVGPHDTGGPTIQAALRAAREELSRHGLEYYGPARLDAARGSRADRLIVSSEKLAFADAHTADALVRDLGGDKVQVILTLQPLASLLPVAWQRGLCNRLTATYDEWLDTIFNHSDAELSETFWRSHRHDDVVERWRSVVGAARLTVIAAASDDEALAAFAKAAALPVGLDGRMSADQERRLTAVEAELLRTVNVEFQERGWRPQRYNRIVRDGVVPHLRALVPAQPDPAVTTPAWAVSRANEIAAAAARRIGESGVRIVGDLSMLSSVPTEAAASRDAKTLGLDLASQAIIGAIDAADRQWGRG